jgi:hypothetical protein
MTCEPPHLPHSRLHPQHYQGQSEGETMLRVRVRARAQVRGMMMVSEGDGG